MKQYMRWEFFKNRVLTRIEHICAVALCAAASWGTVYIISPGYIPGTEGVWEYGTITVYLSDIIATLFVFVAGGNILSSQKRNVLLRWGTLVLIVAVLMVTTSHFPFLAAMHIARWVVWLAAWWLLISRYEWRRVGVWILAGLVSVFLLALAQWGLQEVWATKLLGISAHDAVRLGDSVVETVQGRVLRAYGIFPHPNILGVWAAATVGITLSLLASYKKRTAQAALWGVYILAVTAILVSVSRSAALAVLVLLGAVSLYSLFHKSVRSTASISVGIAFVMSGAFAFAYPDVVSTRTIHTNNTRLEKRSIDERTTSLKDFSRMLRIVMPWGAGLGQATYAMQQENIRKNITRPIYEYQPVHVAPLVVILELGVLGIWLIVLGGALIMKRVASGLFEEDTSRGVLVLSLGSVLIVGSIFDHYFWTIHSGQVLAALCVVGVAGNLVEKPGITHNNLKIHKKDMFMRARMNKVYSQLHRFIKSPMLIAILIASLLWFCAYKAFGDKDSITVLAAISTALVVAFGYFATHHLTMERQRKDEKFRRCLELMKKIRFFILEKNYSKSQERWRMRDELQDAYFGFSLITSAKSYNALSEMMKAFGECLKAQDEPERLVEFKKAQSEFVNCLRGEFFMDTEIDFETYDFQLEEKKVDSPLANNT